MSRDDPQHDRSAFLRERIAQYCDGRLSAEDTAKLEQWLREDPRAMESFLLYMELHSQIAWNARAHVGDSDVGAAVELPHQLGQDAGTAVELPHQLAPEPLIPPIIIDSSPGGVYPPGGGLFAVGGPLFSYAAAVVIVGAAILVSWAWKVSLTGQVAVVNRNSRGLTGPGTDVARELAPVGRITGTANCRWADPQDATPAAVFLGGRYDLAAGRIEITYKTGARVILQGPCTYEVDSPTGGFLSLGKLTARVESRESRVEGTESDVRGPVGSRLSTLDSRLFSVRTPTAVVTDLGTEFGVEVNGQGNTTSYVFRGSVKVLVTGAGGTAGSPGSGQEVILRENQSARVERGAGGGPPRLVPHDAAGNPPKFARRLVEPPDVLDLLDIVAGGNGAGRGRESGLDPTTGMVDPEFAAYWREGAGRYWPVPTQKLIDGVFVPNGAAGPVQIDSAGHAFAGFPPTRNNTWGSIWARAFDAPVGPEDRVKEHEVWVHTMESPGRYMPEKRGLLALCPNAGLTFDLAAIRRVHGIDGPLRFQATAGLAHPEGLADIWVLVDGQLKLKRMGLRQKDGIVRVDVPLTPDDRFLTLASTDGGDGVRCDHIVYGDPVLRVAPIQEEPQPKEVKQ